MLAPHYLHQENRNKDTKRLSDTDLKMESFSPDVQKPFREKCAGEVAPCYETRTKTKDKKRTWGRVEGFGVFKAGFIMWMQNQSFWMHRLGFFPTTFYISLKKKKLFKVLMETAQGLSETHKPLFAVEKFMVSFLVALDSLL